MQLLTKLRKEWADNTIILPSLDEKPSAHQITSHKIKVRKKLDSMARNPALQGKVRKKMTALNGCPRIIYVTNKRDTHWQSIDESWHLIAETAQSRSGSRHIWVVDEAFLMPEEAFSSLEGIPPNIVPLIGDGIHYLQGNLFVPSYRERVRERRTARMVTLGAPMYLQDPPSDFDWIILSGYEAPIFLRNEGMMAQLAEWSARSGIAVWVEGESQYRIHNLWDGTENLRHWFGFNPANPPIQTIPDWIRNMR